MIVANLSEFRATAPGTRLLGLDLGEKTIGLALSDTTLSVATPMQTLKRGKFTADAARLENIISEQASADWWSACRSTWTAATGRPPNRPAPSPAIRGALATAACAAR